MANERIDLTDARNASSVVLDTRRTRPRFFDGKFLTAADLMQEQNYLLARQADLARSLGFGVVRGLQVQRSDVSASGLPAAAASLRIATGHGLTPAGETVSLAAPLVVDLDKVAQLQRLNAAFGLSREPQPPFASLSGLFVLGLRAVEFTANPTPAYPPSVDGNSSLRDGEIIEATAVTLVPYDGESGQLPPALARARVAREIFLDQRPPKLPANILPLALLGLRHGAIEWVDEWLVRREAGDDDRFGFAFAPRALAEAHFLHYDALLDGLPPSGGGLLTAKNLFEILPAAGRLPADALNRADFTQAFFPPEARVDLSIVPADELTALLEESTALPPIDLSLKPEDNDALALLLLAPVPRAEFGDIARKLGTTTAPVTNIAPSRLGQQKPLQSVLQLAAAFRAKRRMEGELIAADAEETAAAAEAVNARFALAAWSDVLAKVPQLWYVRRRNLPDASGLAGQPLAVVATGTKPSTGEVDEETVPSDGGTPSGVPFPTAEEEATVAEVLADEGLWGRFAFLRAVSDLRAHLALIRVLATPLALQTPILQHALLGGMEKAMKTISESPMENFEQIQKDPGVRVLTEEIVRKVAAGIARFDIVRGLETVFKDHPKLLKDRRTRAVLGRTDRLVMLARLGNEFAGSNELPKLAERIEKHASTGRAQAVADAVDRTWKRIRK